MHFIQDLQEGERISEVYLCKTKVTATSKTGKSYYALKLQDKTGTVDGKVWELSNSIEHFESNQYIKVDADVTVYNNALQLNIRRIRVASPGEYDQKDYMPTSEYDVSEMYEKLMGLAGKVTNPHLKALIDSFFFEDAKFIEAFKTHSAAKSVHHSFMGGLLQHTLHVTQLCYFFCLQYPMLNRDLLITCALLVSIEGFGGSFWPCLGAYPV